MNNAIFGTMAIMQMRLQQDSSNSSRIVRITATSTFLDVIFFLFAAFLEVEVWALTAPLSACVYEGQAWALREMVPDSDPGSTEVITCCFTLQFLETDVVHKLS